MSYHDRELRPPGYPEGRPELLQDALTGKIMLITGASRGIGASVARLSAGLGASGIVINSRYDGEGRATALVDELQVIGGKSKTKALWIPGDIADEETAETLVGVTVQEFGRLDVLVNNAGIRSDESFLRMSDAQVRSVFETNFFGAWRLTQEGIIQMIRQGLREGRDDKRGGAVVFTSSKAAEGSPGQINYAASKAAVNALVRSLAFELPRRANIRVNAVSPGLVDTALTADLTSQQRSALLTATQAERELTAEEVAEHIVFLASDQAVGITGRVVPI